MKLIDVINMASALYREEKQKELDVSTKINDINKEFQEAVRNDWETMSVARRNELSWERDVLERELLSHSERADGMHDMREMLLNLLESGEELED